MPAAPQDKSLRRLTKRSEFLRAARGNRTGRPAFALQSVARDAEQPGVGFTVSKQCGNAPQRNRIKRRLRAATRACAEAFEAQHDYVLVGRREALATPFSDLVEDLKRLIARVDAPKPPRNQANGLRKTRP